MIYLQKTWFGPMIYLKLLKKKKLFFIVFFPGKV